MGGFVGAESRGFGHFKTRPNNRTAGGISGWKTTELDSLDDSRNQEKKSFKFPSSQET
jgi:hypothetical protein